MLSLRAFTEDYSVIGLLVGEVDRTPPVDLLFVW